MPQTGASSDSRAAFRTALVAWLASVASVVGAMALLHGLDAAGSAMAVLAVPAVLGLAIGVIDFAWTPWRAAQAERPARDDATETPPAFVDTQASWREPRSPEMAETPLAAPAAAESPVA